MRGSRLSCQDVSDICDILVAPWQWRSYGYHHRLWHRTADRADHEYRTQVYFCACNNLEGEQWAWAIMLERHMMEDVQLLVDTLKHGMRSALDKSRDVTRSTT